MLQQTQVSRVREKYPLFLKRFPTLKTLAAARQSDVVRMWQGMGYNNRAVRLHALARIIVKDHNGRIPRTETGLKALPGIGTYTSRALLASAFAVPVSIVDVNVRRLFSRLLWKMSVWTDMMPERTIEETAAALLPRRHVYDWNQALMDLGATICTARAPQCTPCPLAQLCASASSLRRPAPAPKKSEPSLYGIPNRVYRGRVIEELRMIGQRKTIAVHTIGSRVLPGFATHDTPWLEKLLQGLERDGLVRITTIGRNRTVRLA
jgi:A/G-specific adenine glycosylase